MNSVIQNSFTNSAAAESGKHPAWHQIIPWKWQRLLVALMIVAVASTIRVVFLGGLGRGIPYLTYYPAVMLAALYGGLPAGFLATGVSACLCFFWIQRGFMSPVEWLAMAVFLLSCTMISFICEAMRRAQTRAKLAQEKAEAANRAKSVFLASMSHELRTPLNAILGFSGLLRHDANMSADQRQTLDLINRSGEHLLSLINDVLDMAKIEAGQVGVESAPFDLGAMVRDLIDLMRGRAQEKNLELRLDQSSEFPRFVRADAAKLRQVLLNLIGNAIKFTEQGEVVVRADVVGNVKTVKTLKGENVKTDKNVETLKGENVKTVQPDDRLSPFNPLNPFNGFNGSTPLTLLFTVTDTGIGIAAEDQARVFDPFVQVNNLTFQKGTGLGLTIARQQVELMGGRICVESTPGKGSLFRVEVPVDRVEASEVPAVRIDRGRIVGLAPGQPEYRILIVEDEMANWLLLQRLLEGVGFHVRVAENGAAGLEMFQTWRPHLIWMDVRMPVMNGLEATRRIRALDGGHTVKIVALTASVFKEERDNVTAAGMDDFIRKPYRSEEIYDCLARHLGVGFVYEETPAVDAAEPVGPLSSEALAALPSKLRAELADALVNLDTARIGEITRRVSEQDPALGNALAHHADRLEYTAILQAVQAGRDNSTKKFP